MTDLVDAAKNLTLDELASNITHISLHSAYPGTGGSNELTGGSPAYARQAVTWDASALGVLETSAPLDTFDVAAGSSVAFAGFWSAASAGTFYGSVTLGPVGDPQLATAATSGTFTAPGHTFTDGQQVVASKTLGALPTGVTDGNFFWVRDVSGDTFKLAASSGGAAITVSAAGRAIVRAVTVETYGGQGLYTVSSLSLAIA